MPVTDNAPPILVVPPIPTPPVTFNAPVVVEVEAVEFVISTTPLDVTPTDVIKPSDVMFRIVPMSRVAFTTNALEAETVPAVTLT